MSRKEICKHFNWCAWPISRLSVLQWITHTISFWADNFIYTNTYSRKWYATPKWMRTTNNPFPGSNRFISLKMPPNEWPAEDKEKRNRINDWWTTVRIVSVCECVFIPRAPTSPTQQQSVSRMSVGSDTEYIFSYIFNIRISHCLLSQYNQKLSERIIPHNRLSDRSLKSMGLLLLLSSLAHIVFVFALPLVRLHK